MTSDQFDAWQCPHCLDWFDDEDDDVPPVCIMCRKAGRGEGNEESPCGGAAATR
jgi:hypothetical protein